MARIGSKALVAPSDWSQCHFGLLGPTLPSSPTIGGLGGWGCAAKLKKMPSKTKHHHHVTGRNEFRAYRPFMAPRERERQNICIFAFSGIPTAAPKHPPTPPNQPANVESEDNVTTVPLCPCLLERISLIGNDATHPRDPQFAYGTAQIRDVRRPPPTPSSFHLGSILSYHLTHPGLVKTFIIPLLFSPRCCGL